MPQPAQEKQRTNVTLTAGTLEKARKFGLNVSAISDAALARAVAEAESRAWADRNAAAIAERRRWIETHGAPLADVQVLRID
ncbi:hypothetical protein AL036_09210 [Salipiger aestuarii]|uniref:Antitoxin CcdA n=1 Tax=Salipiger aestuarii TaxID=568098 RepID=A0A327XYS2_9RHOB|nr:type II toxin-antitoxin system CcdA family antitoxin [Salipiger aestuarii]EIE49398.1 hypothetical protein C357_19101 [Citreicella sp. 357]KAA8607802.1 hypothetical protein AL036_09210 [Salipiger aestuarii]KAA8607964.1 hypothetical protein AL037_17975 [Salipiger aestuarii]KAB2541118.1 hypothetical protein AL035_14200 [Salipiger aestuarii]RAK13301.1 antitoxin CcdA [Salipiger aestuarii]